MSQCQIVEGEMPGRDGETANLQYFAPENMPKLVMAYPDRLFYYQQNVNTYFEWNEEWLENLT